MSSRLESFLASHRGFAILITGHQGFNSSSLIFGYLSSLFNQTSFSEVEAALGHLLRPVDAYFVPLSGLTDFVKFMRPYLTKLLTDSSSPGRDSSLTCPFHLPVRLTPIGEERQPTCGEAFGTLVLQLWAARQSLPLLLVSPSGDLLDTSSLSATFSPNFDSPEFLKDDVVILPAMGRYARPTSFRDVASSADALLTFSIIFCLVLLFALALHFRRTRRQHLRSA